MLVCREFMSGHGLHGTCSIAGYKVCVGGRESTVNECVFAHIFNRGDTYFLSEHKALL